MIPSLPRLNTPTVPQNAALVAVALFLFGAIAVAIWAVGGVSL